MRYLPHARRALPTPSAMLRTSYASAKAGFTLLEVLVIVGIIAVLLSIAIVKFKPLQRKQEAFDLKRKADAQSIERATLQYAIETLAMPPGMPVGSASVAKDICQSGVTGVACTNAPVNGVDLSGLAPEYLVDIPVDPAMTGATITGYKMYSDGEDFFVTMPSLGSIPTRTVAGGGNAGVSSAASSSASSAPAGSGAVLIAHWHFNETSGTVAVDSSGNGNNAQLVNGPSWVAGIAGNGINFDATNDEVQVADKPTFDGLSAFTLSAWIHPYSLRDTQIAGISDVYYLKLRSDGRIQFAALPMVSATNSLSTVPINQWTHVSLRYDGSQVTFFINGTPDTIVNATGNTAVTTTPFRIGAASTFHGMIDEVRLDNRALSSAALLALHRAIYPNAQVAYWKFDEGAGSTATDASGNGRTATLMNSPAWNNSALPPLNYTNAYALKFDGGNDYVTVPNHSSIDFRGLPGFTVTMWAYLDTSMPESALIGMRDSSRRGWYFHITYPRTVSFDLNSENSAYYALSTPGWYHVSGVWDGQSIKLYLNGTLIQTTSYSAPPGQTGTQTLQIGRYQYWGNTGTEYYFDEKIDDVRLFNRPLAAAEIKVFGSGDPPL